MKFEADHQNGIVCSRKYPFPSIEGVGISRVGGQFVKFLEGLKLKFQGKGVRSIIRGIFYVYDVVCTLNYTTNLCQWHSHKNLYHVVTTSVVCTLIYAIVVKQSKLEKSFSCGIIKVLDFVFVHRLMKQVAAMLWSWRGRSDVSNICWRITTYP